MATTKKRTVNSKVEGIVSLETIEGSKLAIVLEGEFKLRVSQSSITLTGNPKNVKIDYREPRVDAE